MGVTSCASRALQHRTPFEPKVWNCVASVNTGRTCARAFSGGRAAVVAKWKAAFKEADLDGSGFLEKGEVKKLLEKESSGNDAPSAAEVEACMSQADRNNDGRIDLDE